MNCGLALQIVEPTNPSQVVRPMIKHEHSEIRSMQKVLHNKEPSKLSFRLALVAGKPNGLELPAAGANFSLQTIARINNFA